MRISQRVRLCLMLVVSIMLLVACRSHITFAQKILDGDFQRYCSDNGFRRKRFSRYCQRIWLKDKEGYCRQIKDDKNYKQAYHYFCYQLKSDLVLVGPDKGAIILLSSPRGMSIFINDRNTNKTTPFRISNLEPAYYNIALKKRGYYPWSKRVRIARGQEIKLEAEAQAKTVRLDIFVNKNPDFISIGGKVHQPEKTHFNLLPGVYDLVIKRRGYHDYKNKISMLSGKSLSLNVKLTWAVDTKNMKYFPAGEFLLDKAKIKGNPAKPVKVPEFYIDKTEVTVKEYSRCVEAKKCREPLTGEDLNWKETKKGWRIFSSDKSDHPINGVSWKDADSYCSYKGKRLPTEIEWEIAAKWKDGKKFLSPVAKETIDCDVAVVLEKGFFGGPGCGKKRTWSVASKQAELNGTFDMAGNVSEWIGNIYPEATAVSKSQSYSTKAVGKRTVRGGSWLMKAEMLKDSVRRGFDPNTRNREIGFRCISAP